MHAFPDVADAFVTLDGSTIRELAGRVSPPTDRQSLAEATVPAGGSTAERPHVVGEELCLCPPAACNDDTVLTGN
jgi:hypothetical protein